MGDPLSKREAGYYTRDMNKVRSTPWPYQNHIKKGSEFHGVRRLWYHKTGKGAVSNFPNFLLQSTCYLGTIEQRYHTLHSILSTFSISKIGSFRERLKIQNSQTN